LGSSGSAIRARHPRWGTLERLSRALPFPGASCVQAPQSIATSADLGTTERACYFPVIGNWNRKSSFHAPKQCNRRTNPRRPASRGRKGLAEKHMRDFGRPATRSGAEADRQHGRRGTLRFGDRRAGYPSVNRSSG